MKKTLVALATLAVAGGAAAQVTITGFFNGSYDNFSISNTTRTSNTSENRVSDNSSRIIFGVNQSLTSDLNAIGQFDLRFSIDQTARVNAACALPAVGAQTAITNANLNAATVPAGVSITTQTAASAGACATPNPVSSGNSHVGLSSKSMGTFRLGRQDIHYTENANFNPVGLPLLHNAATVATTAAASTPVARSSRTANLIWWTSPKFNNFDVTAGYSTNSQAASGVQDTENDMASNQRKGGTTYLRLSYTNGPLAVVYSTINEKMDWIGTAASYPSATGAAAAQTAWNAQADRNGNIITAKYDLGVAKLGVGYFENESTGYTDGTLSTTTSKRNAYQFGVGIPMGAQNFAVTYTKVGSVKANGVESANTGATHTTFAYSYDFSKTTQGVIAHTQLSNQGSGAHSLFYNGDNVVGSIGSAAAAGEKHSATSIGLRVSF